MNERLEQLSEWIGEAQKILSEEFGIPEVYIGGASSISILDHVWHREPLVLRDLDLYVVHGKPVDKDQALKIAARLETPKIGKLAPAGVTPHFRCNPALPMPERNSYLTGWGLDFLRGNDVMDITLNHSRDELSLNGIFSCDMVKIRLMAGQSLVETIRDELLKFSYTELVAKGTLYDEHEGYPAWRSREPRVINWHEVERDPIVQSVRVARSLGKHGLDRVPSEIVRFVRPRIERRPEYDRTKLRVALQRVENDPRSFAERHMLSQMGMESYYGSA